MRSLLVSLILAGAAFAAECGNCGGDRVVGRGPGRLPCPVCGGTGEIAELEPVVEAAVKAAPAAPVAGRPRPVVARISAADGPSRIYGSGVLVEASGTTGIVLTNWHVVRSHRHGISVSWPDGSTSPAKVLASDELWDLAALVVQKPAVEPVTITASAPRLGDTLTIAGYGPAGKYLEQSGPVTDYLSPVKNTTRQFVEIRASARQGDSGGPMFNADGELAGVLFGQRDGRTVGPCSTRVSAFLATATARRAASCSVCEAGR
jgi:S1-C subfamily serine protease